MCMHTCANGGRQFQDSLRKLTFHEDGLQAVGKVRQQFKEGPTSPPSMRMAYVRQGRPTVSRTVFTSPPSMRIASGSWASSATTSRMVFTSPPSIGRLTRANGGRDFKEGLHKPTFLQDALHAPKETDNFKDGLRKPTFHGDGLQAVCKFGDNFKDGLPCPLSTG